MSYEKLFEPIKIGSMEVKNRIFMAPMGTLCATKKHQVTDAVIEHYAARARGGVGLVTTEVTIVEENSRYFTQFNLGLYDDSQIEGMRRLADAVHAYGSKIVTQLFHVGPAGLSVLNEGRQPVGASPCPAGRLEIPRPLSVEEIPHYVELFASAAERAKRAGLDGVEIHCCHKHGLLGHFLSALHNKRTDEYGGDLDGRLKFPLEVITAVRERVGKDFAIIIIRLSATETEYGGQSLAEGQYIAKKMEQAGADLIHLSNGTVDVPAVIDQPTGTGFAHNADFARAIKSVVSIPVGVVGRITDPRIAETILESGAADAVYLARALSCDPDFANKTREGRVEDIRPCVGCTHCISTLGQDGRPVNCTMNPYAGRGDRGPGVAEEKKKVLVIGGGPAGLAAATAAKQRGHHVTLWEKANELGGQAIAAAYPPGKQEYAVGMKYLICQAKKEGVNIELGREATLEDIQSFGADEVLVATGGEPLIPAFLQKPHVIPATDILLGKAVPGGNTLVIGGGAIGCETADHILVAHDPYQIGGRSLTIVEQMSELEPKEFHAERCLMMERLSRKGANMMTGVRVEAILEDGIVYSCNGEEKELHGFDTIVAALGVRSNNALAKELKEHGIPHRVIGDAQAVAKVTQAIQNGTLAAEQI